MEVKERVYDIDDLREIVSRAESADLRFELIKGELCEMPPTGEEHGQLMMLLGKYLLEFVQEHKLGRVTGDVGYYPEGDRSTLLSPDVAFRRLDDAAAPSRKWVPLMPDLAVEIKSPNDTLAEIRRKALIYLQNGSQLVWIVSPVARAVEVCSLDDEGEMQTEVISADGTLAGGDVLPGFELPLGQLFAW